MAQQHKTFENIHNGLSTNRGSEKWKNMLNFRSCYGITKVVPFKKKLHSLFRGQHTLVNGLQNWFYTFGTHLSYVLKGSDSSGKNLLWRGSVKVLDEKGPKLNGEKKLLVRGAYTGEGGKKMRVTFSKGELKWYEEPEETVSLPEEEVFVDCGLDGGDSVKVRVFELLEDESLKKVARPEVVVYYGLFVRASGSGNGEGVFSFKSKKGVVKIEVSAGGFVVKNVFYTVTDGEQQEVEVILEKEIVEEVVVELPTIWYLETLGTSSSLVNPAHHKYNLFMNGSFVGEIQTVANGFNARYFRLNESHVGRMDEDDPDVLEINLTLVKVIPGQVNPSASSFSCVLKVLRHLPSTEFNRYINTPVYPGNGYPVLDPEVVQVPFPYRFSEGQTTRVNFNQDNILITERTVHPSFFNLYDNRESK